jgi:hypothetical protein
LSFQLLKSSCFVFCIFTKILGITTVHLKRIS